MSASEKTVKYWHCRPILFFQVLSLACVLNHLRAAKEYSDRDYLKLEQKLKTTTDPIHKVKILIKLSDFQLRDAALKAKKTDFTEADQYLSHYLETILQTQNILKSSGRNAKKNPAGFKEFEIALKRQVRALEDLRSVYPYEQADKVNGTIQDVKAAQENMLLQIFGEGNIGSRKETR